MREAEDRTSQQGDVEGYQRQVAALTARTHELQATLGVCQVQLREAVAFGRKMADVAEAHERDCAEAEAQCAALQEAASERDAIATLLTDRGEAGTYAKVEALVESHTALQEENTALQKLVAQLTAEKRGIERLRQEALSCQEQRNTEVAALTQERDQWRTGHNEIREELMQAEAQLAAQAETIARLTEAQGNIVSLLHVFEPDISSRIPPIEEVIEKAQKLQAAQAALVALVERLSIEILEFRVTARTRWSMERMEKTMKRWEQALADALRAPIPQTNEQKDHEDLSRMDRQP